MKIIALLAQENYSAINKFWDLMREGDRLVFPMDKEIVKIYVIDDSGKVQLL